MTIAKIRWVKLRDYSLAWSTREAGFDLTMYEEYPKAVQEVLKKEAVKTATEYLEDEYEEKTGDNLKELAWGVHVIRLSSGFSIQYAKGIAPIVYIGRGSVGGRVKSHFGKKLFPLMQSLSGANFDFWITDPKTGTREKPLLNKNNGTDHGLILGQNWDKPLGTKGQRPKWILNPTKHFTL